MTAGPLKFISDQRLTELNGNISRNRTRYLSESFQDLQQENGWAIEAASVAVDYELLTKLDGTQRGASADIESSLIVFRALKGMTPALACEERVWVRLTHIECLDYSRARWLEGYDGEELDKQVRRHMFCPTLTGVRDDNAVSRLWWNFHIASIADPDDAEAALKLILKSADIRSNFVERTGTAARGPLARAVIRAMRRCPAITSSEANFRSFMRVLNVEGGGVLFEVLRDDEADALMDRCAAAARALEARLSTGRVAAEGKESVGAGSSRSGGVNKGAGN